jgi:MFS family permease
MAGARVAVSNIGVIDTRARVPPALALVGLLAAAIFINYIDRGNLATAAPFIKDELHLTNLQLGIIASAFFWTYTPAQLLAAWLADRLNPYRALALGFTIWSVATTLTGFADGFISLLVFRFFLGLGESVAFPCTSKLMAKHVPASALGFANGITQSGIGFGPVVGTLAGGFLMLRFGWRAMFVVFGVAALFWLLPWFQVTQKMRAPATDAETHEPPPFTAILSLRAFWGGVIGHFTGNYTLYFVMTWLPLYLVKERGFSIAEMAEISGLSYAIYGICSLGAGWVADRWVASGASINRVRKATAVVGYFGIAICLIGVAMGSRPVAIVFLLMSNVFSGFAGTSLWAITQTLSGPRAAARWVGMQNCLANFAGIAGPLVTGVIADRTGSFVNAFLVAAAMALIGAAAWAFVIRRVEPVRWESV